MGKFLLFVLAVGSIVMVQSQNKIESNKVSTHQAIDTTKPYLITCPSRQYNSTFYIENFKFTGIYHKKQQPDIDLETEISLKTKEYMLSFDLVIERLGYRKVPTPIYVAITNNKDGRTMSITEEQPDVFFLDGQAIEYTISKVPDFEDKLIYPMKWKWNVLKNDKSKNTELAECTISIYTDNEKLGEFQAILIYLQNINRNKDIINRIISTTMEKQ